LSWIRHALNTNEAGQPKDSHEKTTTKLAACGFRRWFTSRFATCGRHRLSTNEALGFIVCAGWNALNGGSDKIPALRQVMTAAIAHHETELAMRKTPHRHQQEAPRCAERACTQNRGVQ